MYHDLPPDDPTLATAGARTCRVGEVVELGPTADVLYQYVQLLLPIDCRP